jgi:SAM-dependent methyltransferase
MNIQYFLVSASGESFPVVNGIPRFVARDNYAQAFGLQWKAFARTQLDSFNGTSISKDRLERCLGSKVEDLAGMNVLEVGCGAGRFTELLVKGGAHVHSIDLSEAVEVNKENIGGAEHYTVAQASVFDMPFPDTAFDVVICLGVIQHTPSSERTIEALWEKVKPGGLLVIDHYKWRLGYYANLAPVYRFFLKRMPPDKSKRKVDALVDFYFPLHWKLRNNRAGEWLLHRISPLLVYTREFPDKDRVFQYEWSKLDTYDSLTDFYKHLKTPGQIRRILSRLGGRDIWINLGGNGVEARCRK